MKIIALTDLHGKVPNMDEILKQTGRVNLILLTGDITNFGGEPEAKKVIHPLLKYYIPIRAVRGNCDLAGVDKALDDFGMQIHGSHFFTDQIAIMGVGGSLPCPGNTPYEMSEASFEQILQSTVCGLDVDVPFLLVSHQPPYGTLNDSLTNGMHVGSHEVRAFIEKKQPLVCFTGHIHEGHGIDTIGQTQVINPGPAHQGGYGYVQISGDNVIVEIRKISNP